MSGLRIADSLIFLQILKIELELESFKRCDLFGLPQGNYLVITHFYHRQFRDVVVQTINDIFLNQKHVYISIAGTRTCRPIAQ